jgi:hypothetical protein
MSMVRIERNDTAACCRTTRDVTGAVCKRTCHVRFAMRPSAAGQHCPNTYSLVRLSRTVQLATPSLVESSIAVLVFASDWTTEQQC